MTEPKITPLARRLAEENGIDWHSLEGTGPDGTIVERDILAFLAKVMAGEVELPPEPADMVPPEAVPDISQVQEVLAREGVDISELVPEASPEASSGYEPATAAEEIFIEEETFFEMDFDEEAPIVDDDTVFGADEVTATEGSFEEEWTVVEPEPQAEATTPWLEGVTETAEEAAGLETLEDLDFGEEAAGFEASPEDLDLELEEAGLPTETPETAAVAGAAEELDVTEEAATADEVVEEASAEASADAADEGESALAAETAADEPEPEPEDAGTEPEMVSSEETSEVEADAATPVAAAAVTTAIFPPAFRRAVSLTAAERARADLATAWRREVPLELLLFRAVDRALAELEVPMRPVLGRLEGEEARALAVQPALGLRDLYENLMAAEEDGEGLVVIDLSETPYAEVLLPDKVLITLGRAGLPENLGLLSISGDLPTDRTRFLERVAFYLERPILLA